MIKKLQDTQAGKLIHQSVSDRDLLELDDNNVITFSFEEVVNSTPLRIIGVLTGDINPFASPIVVDSKLGKTVYCDLRPFVGKTRLEEGYPSCINDTINAGLLLDISYLMGIWGTNSFNSFTITSKVGYRVFNNVVSLLLANKLSLNVSDQLTVQALLGIMFVDILDFNENKNQYARAKAVLDIVGDANHIATAWLYENQKKRITSLEDLTEEINSYGTTPSLQNLTKDAFLVSVINIVTGNAVPMIAGISLEFPPYFIALLHTLHMRKTFKRTILGGAINRIDSKLKPLHNTFTKAWEEQHYLLRK